MSKLLVHISCNFQITLNVNRIVEVEFKHDVVLIEVTSLFFYIQGKRRVEIQLPLIIPRTSTSTYN